MKNNRLAIIFFHLALLVGGVFYYSKAQAANDPRIATGVQVSPVRFDWDLNAGDERTAVINLKNYSDKSYQVGIELEDFYVTSDTTEAKFFVPNENHPLYAYDVINWIDGPKEISLGPNEGKDVIFKVKVPENTPTGGYYGAIFFRTVVSDNSDSTGNNRVIVNQRVGVLLVMAVKGSEPIDINGVLNDFKASKKVFWSSPAEFTASIQNIGNLHFKMVGTFEINEFGKKIFTESVPERIIYPKSIREYPEAWNFSPWSFGYYKAKIDFISLDQKVHLVGVTSFWVIPWKTLVALLIIIIIIWLLYRIFINTFEIKRKDPSVTDKK